MSAPRCQISPVSCAGFFLVGLSSSHSAAPRPYICARKTITWRRRRESVTSTPARVEKNLRSGQPFSDNNARAVRFMTIQGFLQISWLSPLRHDRITPAECTDSSTANLARVGAFGTPLSGRLSFDLHVISRQKGPVAAAAAPYTVQRSRES